MTALEQLRFDALRNANYHTARRNWFEGWNRAMNFVVVLAGAAAMADLLAQQTLLTFVATLAGTLQLVYDFGGRARTHEFLQRRYYEVLAKIVEAAGDEARHDGLFAEMVRIYADEPPIMRALDAVAYNDAADSLNTDRRVGVTRWQSRFRHLRPYHGVSFPWRVVTDAR